MKLTYLTLAIAEALPNPDGFATSDEVIALREQIKEAIAGLKAFDSYCDGKSSAMILRERGEIENAMKFEACCDDVYKHLPGFVKVW